jgi:hypothetical protein
MNVWKASLLIDYFSDPQNFADATAHQGGWSETFWWGGAAAPNLVGSTLVSTRATLLAKTCRIVAARVQQYDLTNSIFTPQGSISQLIQRQGNAAYAADLPQVALGLVATSAQGANSRRFTLRGIPDEMMQNGEYQPTPAYKGQLTAFINAVIGDAWSFPGLGLDQPAARISSTAAGKVTVDDATPFAVGNYVTFLKCRDVNGKPVSGRFRVTAKDVNTLTLDGLDPAIVTKNVGRLRRYAAGLLTINAIGIGRARVKKIGRPFDQYRGRASKKRR